MLTFVINRIKSAAEKTDLIRPESGTPKNKVPLTELDELFSYIKKANQNSFNGMLLFLLYSYNIPVVSFNNISKFGKENKMKKLVMSSLVFPMLFSCVSAMELPQDGGQSSEGRTLRVFRDLALRVRDNNAGKPQRTAVVDPVAARFKAEFAVPATAPEALEEEEQQVEQPAAEEPVAEEPVADPA
ncbi:MAG: hypothetical protein LBO73_04030 [Holosporaceae bacterium]|jgi:hypothetical protein|nr:hypothetical protein [Holosporaceae bacterium]